METILVYISRRILEKGLTMFVCLCHGISDKKLRKLALEDGISDMRSIRKCTALGSQCGKCVKQAKEILSEVSEIQFKQAS